MNSVQLSSLLNVFLLCFCVFHNAEASIDHIKRSNTPFNQVLLQHQNNPEIIAVVPASFPPFYLTDEENMPYGMAIEVMNEIDHHAGYTTRYIVKSNWKNVFDAIDKGEAHVIPSLGITPARKKKYLFTRPYAKTDINVFTRENFKLNNKQQLKTLSTGAVEKNIGVKIARQEKIQNLEVFPSIKEALLALINKDIDALIYPKIITLRDAKSLQLSYLIEDTGITLKTIQRAIAVHNNYPEIHAKLDTAIADYIKTQNYTDTYSAWYGNPPINIDTKHLIVIDLIIFIACIIIFTAIWRKKKFSLFKKDGTKKTDIIWVITLVSILLITTLSITAITLSILYNTAFEEQRHRLIEITKARARLIESVARYDLNEYQKNKPESGPSAAERTITQVTNAHNKFRGFGDTGEFVMARLDNKKKEIQFILRQRHSDLDTTLNIPFESHLATPMRMALLGHSGTIVDTDYRGTEVLSAYEPVSILDLGIVAKIDLNEIRRPYINSALIIIAIVILLSLIGVLLFFSIMSPIINRLNYTEQHFAQLFKNTQTPAFTINPVSGRIIDTNKAASNFYGYSRVEFTTYRLNILYPDQSDELDTQIQQTLSDNNRIFKTQHRLKNGELRDVEVITNLVDLDDETVISLVVTDITEKIQQERKYKQSQLELEQARKMEALGQLTGGIAHDFNNMLGVIMGYSSLSLDKIKNNKSDKVEEYLQQVLTASNRAKDLIASMMIFSRTGESKNRPMKITSMVKEDVKMMRSIIPSSIKIHSDISKELPAVLIEPVKLQQLIMNLCVNARDAMEGEGTLTITLGMHKNAKHICQVCYEKIHGDWIELSIRDTGMGMTQQTVQRIFEPFFTTKAHGKGTGMGMSVVHGIVTELGGHALIESAPGQGTKISILLSPVYETKEDTIETLPANHAPDTEKNILIVDDETSIAELLKSILESKGYQCTSFSSSSFALSHFEQHSMDYDLVISDQTMPEITGFQLINEMRKIRANIPAIISTGYSENFNESVASKSNIVFLPKPVSKEKLLSTVNQIFC